MAQAQSDADKHRIMEQMESSPELLKILHALQETDKEDMIQEERARRQAARRSRVDADIEAGLDETGGVRRWECVVVVEQCCPNLLMLWATGESILETEGQTSKLETND